MQSNCFMNANNLISNARNLGHSAHATAFAVELATGQRARALCCWCLEKCDPAGALEAHRVPVGGDCSGCSYIGRDTLVAIGVLS